MARRPFPSAPLAVGGAILLLLLTSCRRDNAHQGGCLDGADGCRLPTPCEKLTFACPSGDTLQVGVLSRTDTVPGGPNELASEGDVLLTNGRVSAVIAALGTQNYLDPNGGSLLDLSSRTGGQSDDNDAVNSVWQLAGILPADSARYERLETFNDAPARVGVQVSGTLDGHPDARIITLYELRPCEPGLRVRTEIINEGADPQLWFLSDGWFWAKREPIPFAPYEGGGFKHPAFGLTTINGAFRPFPFMAASQHTAPYASYSEVACNQPMMEGIHSETISAVGLNRTAVQPREYMVFERFIAVTPGDDVAEAAHVALDVRQQLFGERSVVVSGTVSRMDALSLGTEREVSIQLSEGTAATDPAQRVPWSQVVPDATGRFEARVPAGKTYVLEALSFGHKQVEKDLGMLEADADAGTITLPSTARVTLEVTENGGRRLNAYVFFIAADEATRSASAGNLHGQFGTCSPWLGPPPGASPACNRVLTSEDAPVTLEVPVGTYHVYAFKGPFHTIDRQERLTLSTGIVNLSFSLRPLQTPARAPLSADLHVHGSASFDSMLPEIDRVRSFDAANLEVIVATDHEVVHDYTRTVMALGLDQRMSTVVGTETTGHIPTLRVPNYPFPIVIGHYNFWPLLYDPTQPRNGGAFDEAAEPGTLFDRFRPLYAPGVASIAQLNHPWAEPEFGRDLGFPRAIKLNALQNLPVQDDGTNNGFYVRTPPGSSARNDAHDSQEVMNGTDNDTALQYRAFWWYVLNQGQRKVGTANSDSHGLDDNIAGMPRNLVYATTQAGPNFSEDTFNRAILAGRVLGTNGPVIEATVDLASGSQGDYGTQVHTPAVGGAVTVQVFAAPWIPVEEVRFVVNGKVVKTETGAALTRPADPFGTAGMLRYDRRVPLTELLAGVTGDAWLVIEAGARLPLAGDLGGGLNGQPDGIPDTTDNDGDGQVTLADRAPDASVGPIRPRPLPTDPADPAYHYSAITRGHPMGFTNPFFLDRTGNGQFDAPGVNGGR